MKKLLLLFAILVGSVAQAQIDPGYVEVNYYSFGSALSDQGYELEVGFDLEELDDFDAVFSFGIGEFKETIVPTFGMEGSADLIGNSLQIGYQAKAIAPFSEQSTFGSQFNLISELNNFRFKTGYALFTDINKDGLSGEGIIFGVGYKF